MATLTESFNTADSDTLGPDNTWVEDNGDFDIVSNKAEVITTPAIVFAEARIATSLSTDNHSVQAKVESTAASGAAGVMARKDASSTRTYYLGDCDFTANTTRLYRCVTGNFTSLAAGVATTFSTNTQYLVKLSCIGTTILTSLDGTAKHSVSDTNITGNLQVGIRSDATGKKFDELSAADIPAVTHRASIAGTGNTTTSVGIVIPASTVANDIVIAAFTNGGSTADPSVSDNEGAGSWAKVLSGNDGGSNLSVWWKRASGSTAGKTITASGFTNSCAGVCSVYPGALTSGNPYGGQTYQSNASGTESHAAITPTVDGSMVFLVVGNQPDIAIATQAATSPAVLLERAEHLSTGGLDSSVALASEVQVTAGSTGALTWAQTNQATMSIAFYLTPQSFSLSATVNQIIETDLAQAVARFKLKAIGQNTETDLAQTVTRVKSKTIAQRIETDLAQPVAVAPKIRRVNQAIESDLSQAVARLKTKAIGQTLETDFAQEITRDTSVIVAVNQTTETDLAQAIARLKTKAVNQALETDLAQVLAGVKTRSIAQITETDLAQALTRSKLKALGQVTETDLAQAVTELKIKGISQITEADLAQAITRLKTLALNQVVETDLAQAIVVSGLKLINVAQVSETDLAQALLWNPKIRIVSQITETDLAQAIARIKTQSIAQALETDLAQAISRLKVKALGQVTETDIAQIITVVGKIIVAVGQVNETDLAQAIAWAPKVRLLGQVTETDIASLIASIKAQTLGMVSESSLAQSLTAAKAKEIAQALETDFAQSVAWSPKIRLLAQAFETDLAQIILYIPSQTVGNVWRFEAVIIGASKLDTAAIAGASFTGAAVATSKLTDAEFKE